MKRFNRGTRSAPLKSISGSLRDIFSNRIPKRPTFFSGPRTYNSVSFDPNDDRLDSVSTSRQDQDSNRNLVPNLVLGQIRLESVRIIKMEIFRLSRHGKLKVLHSK